MPWFKIDDGFSNSKPVLRIPRRFRTAAVGLWTLAGAWSAKELTDGYVPDYLLEELAATPASARHLVDCGLWETVDNGWRFKGWEKYQPTREQVTADREREAERKRQWRASKRSPGGTKRGRTVGHQAESGHPDPTRPDPTRPTDTDVSVAPPNDEPPTASADAPRDTSSLLGAWISSCPTRPPGRVVGHVGKEVKTMLDEGVAYDVVEAGLTEWQRKGLHPSTLASVVHEVANKVGPKSRSDEHMALAQRLAAEEHEQQSHLRAIGGGR